jgi:amidase
VKIKIWSEHLEMGDSWKQDCAKARQALMESIPPKWRLSTRPSESQTDLRSVPRTCGLLTERQLEITEQNASDLMPKLLDGRLSSVEVTEAFCARAAIAHQCVCCT